MRLVDAENTNPPPRTRERQALADAIAAHVAAVDHQRRVEQAHANAEEVVWATNDALAQAETQLAEAKKGEPAHFAAVALGETPATISVADAEFAVTKATNDRGIAKRTRDALQASLVTERAEIDRAERKRGAAIIAVAQAETPVESMLTEAVKARENFITSRRLLMLAQRHRLYATQDEARAIADYLAFPFLFPELNESWIKHPALGPMQQALEALKVDADALLPTS
jgi:hypothetical protein